MSRTGTTLKSDNKEDKADLVTDRSKVLLPPGPARRLVGLEALRGLHGAHADALHAQHGSDAPSDLAALAAAAEDPDLRHHQL